MTYFHEDEAKKIFFEPLRAKTAFFMFLALFWAYIGQPDDHIGWVTLMPFASINPIIPRTNLWNFGENCSAFWGGWKTQFFWVGHFEIFLIFFSFASFLSKLVKIYGIARITLVTRNFLVCLYSVCIYFWNCFMKIFSNKDQYSLISIRQNYNFDMLATISQDFQEFAQHYH